MRFIPILGKIKNEIRIINMHIIIIKVYFEVKKDCFSLLKFIIIKIKPTANIKNNKKLINVIY